MPQNTVIGLLIQLKDGVSGVVRKVDSSLGRMQQTADRVGKSVVNIQNGLAALGAGAALASITSKFAQFDDTMRAAGAVSGATAEELDRLTGVAQKMGETTRFSASESADALRLMGMAGFDAGQQIDSLPSVLQLAAAGATDLGRAADISTNIMTAYGKTAADLAGVNDVLVKAFTSSNSTLEELGTAFSYVGPIAKGLGTDFEDLVAAMANLHNAGIKGSMAGTSLRGVLDALFNPTKQEAEMMANLSERIGGAGLQIRDAEGNFVGFASVLGQLEKAGITADEALKLFGQRAGPGMAALIEQGSGALAKMKGELEASGGTAERIAEQMEAGIGGTIRALKSAFEGLQIAAGDAIQGSLTQLFQYLTGEIRSAIEWIRKLQTDGTIDEWAGRFVEALKRTVEYLKSMAGTVMGVADALSPLLAVLVKISPELIALGVAAMGASQAMGAMRGAMSLGMAMAGDFGLAMGKAKGMLYQSTLAVDALKASLATLAAVWGIKKIAEAVGEFGKMRDASRAAEEAQRSLLSTSERVVNQLAKYAEVKIPGDIADAGLESFKRLHQELTGSRAYWYAYLTQLEAANDGSVEAALKITAVKERLAALNTALANVGGAVQNYRQATETQLAGIEGRYKNHYDVLVGMGEEKAKRIQTALNAEIAAVNEAVLAGTKSVADGEAEKTALISKAEAEIAQIRNDAVQDVISAKEDEIAAVREMTSEYIAAQTERYEQGEIQEKEYQRRRQEATQAAEERILGIQKSMMDERFAAVQKLETQGVISTEEATQRKLAAEQAYHDKAIAAARERLDAIASAENARTGGIEAAQKRIESLESAHAARRADIVKSGVEAMAAAEETRVEAAEKAGERIIQGLQRHMQMYSAEYERGMAEINNLEARGVISHEQAVLKKKHQEDDWLNFKVQQTEAAVNAAIKYYGKDSEEYAKAVADKKAAEAAVLEAQTQRLQKQQDAEAAAAQKTAETARKTTEAQKKAVGELTDYWGDQYMSASEEVAASFGQAGDKAVEEMDRAITVTRKMFAEPLKIDVDTSPAEAALDAMLQKYKTEYATQLAFIAELGNKAMESGGRVAEMYRRQMGAARDELQKIENRANNAVKTFSTLQSKVPDMSFNVDFTGTGSTKKPLSEKIAEMAGKFAGFGKKIKDGAGAFNLDMTQMSKGMADAVSAMPNRAAGALAGVSPPQSGGRVDVNLNGLQNLGRIDIADPRTGASVPVVAGKGMVDQLNQLLRRKRLTSG